jgi:hypothetical protein
MDRMTERRRDRRIPLGCKVGIRLEGQAAPVVGTCVELSVGADDPFQPRPAHGRGLRDRRAAPEPGGVYQPLHARVRVRRCDGLAQPGLYAMGVEIVEVIK